MINIFKKGIEYNNLAKAFNGLYQMVQQLETKAEYENVQEELFLLAYIGRKEIVDRLEEYKWSVNTPITVPNMPGERKTLAFAFQQTIGKLTAISENEGFSTEVQEIFNKESLYYDLDKSIPEYMKVLV